MAFSNAPVAQTYSTKRVPAAYDMDLRPNSAYLTGSTTYQDAGMINLLPVKVKDQITGKEEIHAVTREPIHAYEVVNSNLINRGCYVWEKAAGTTYYFSVNGTGVYTATDPSGTWTSVVTLATSATTPVRFTEFIDGTNTKSLVLVDGIEGHVFTSNSAVTKITDGDFPSPHVPFPVYLDGYLFLAKAGTGDIYNSNLENPLAWTAGDFLSSELYPDDIQALVKVNNYLLAVGTQGCEFFYDAANPTASPLARYDGGSLPFGTQLPNSIASNKNVVMLIANSNDGENSFQVIEDFKNKEISSFVIPALNHRLSSASNPATAAGVRGFFFRQFGKLFYGLSFQGTVSSPVLLNPTWVFSFETGYWIEMRAGAAGLNPFPVYFTSSSRSDKISTFVSGHIGGTPFFGQMEEGAKTPYSGTAEDYVVNGPAAEAIYTEIRTPSMDFETRNFKTMSRLGLDVTENSSSTTTSGSTVSINVSWTDDDFATYSTPRSLIFGASLEFPFLTQLGRFRKRSFKFTYASTLFLRYKNIEMDINKDQQ